MSNWIWSGFYLILLIAAVWHGESRYRWGIYDGFKNPTIPPVVRALAHFRKKGFLDDHE